MGQPGKDAADVLDTLIRGLGLPRSLGELKVTPEHYARIAEAAMKTAWMPKNPRPVAGPADVAEILRLAACCRQPLTMPITPCSSARCR